MREKDRTEPAPTAETIVLAPSPDRAYFAAHWRLRADPSRVTICVHAGPVVRVAIVGWHPGVRLVVGARAPVWHVRVHAGWGPPAVWLHDEDWDDEGEVRLHLGGPGRGHGHGRGHGWRKHH